MRQESARFENHQYFSTVYKNTGLKEGRREGRRQATVELLQEMGMEKNACVQRYRKSSSFLSKRLSRK